jgi:hypothetical protein
MIGFIGTSLQLQSIRTVHNQSKSRSIPCWATSVFSSQSQSHFMAGGLPPISLSSRQAPWDSRPAFLFQLNTCFHSPYVTFSPMRGWVCSWQLLLALASAAILGSASRGTHDHILLSQILDSQNLEVPVFISPRNRVAQLYPQALCSRFVSYDSQGYGGGIGTHLFSALLPVTMENVCCHGNMLTDPLASNELLSCCGNVCLANRWLAMDFRSGSAIPVFRRNVTVTCI